MRGQIGFVKACVVGMTALQTLLAPMQALAQIPPHRPGAVCLTPRLWCWINPPVPVGALCHCQTPRGPIAGTGV